MRVRLECDEPSLVQVIDDPLHVLAIRPQVASQPRDRLSAFGCGDGAKNLPAGTCEFQRVLWVGGAGGLEVKPGVRVIDSPDMPLWVKPGALATINALDQLRKEPELEWSFLSPSAELNPGDRTEKFRLGNDQLLVDPTGQSKISVQDYAVAMIDELERPAHVRQRFTVGY